MKLAVYIVFMTTASAAAISIETGTGTKNTSIVGIDAKSQSGKIGLPSLIAKKAQKAATNKTMTKLSKLFDVVENKNTTTRSISQKLLESQHDLRDYVSHQMNQVYEILKELSNRTTDWHKILEMDVDRIPSIADTFYVGKFNNTYKLLNTQYTNVRVYGMSDFKNYVLWVDRNGRKAKATLMANQLKIVGDYASSNCLKHARGSFTVKLLDVSFTENDHFYKFENEVDIVTGEATVVYGKSEYDYRKIGTASILMEDVDITKLIQETVCRVGKELAHRIRHVIVSKIAQITSQKEASSNTNEFNRITSMVRSMFSQIRIWLKKTGTVKVPLPRGFHKVKIPPNTIPISNISLTGLNTMHLDEQIKAFRKDNNFHINIDGQAGPLIISGIVVMTEPRNGTLEQIPLNVYYEVFRVHAKIFLSSSLPEEGSFQVDNLIVSISQPNLRIEPGKIDFKSEDLLQLAEALKPGVESDLQTWLKDFVDDTFKRNKGPVIAISS